MSATHPEAAGSEGFAGRATCYRCFRPAMRCICALCRRVDNRTFVHILQHPRERFHPFGTARIAELSLARVALHVAFGRAQHDVHHPLALPPDTALLYPSSEARDVCSLSPAERPGHLLVLDGTWRQAHQLVRDNPWLATLPRLSIDPPAPSRYRIRKEPAAHCLSTVESIAACLRALEPDTPGLDQLEHTFVTMIDRQIAHERGERTPVRHKVRTPRESRAVPAALRGDPTRVLVVYGESSQITTRRDPRARELLQWTALRPATGETFERFLQPSRGAFDEDFLALMSLGLSDVADAIPRERFVADWRDFARPDDVLVAWNASASRMLAATGVPHGHSLMLKAAYANVARRRPGTLESVIAREDLTPRPTPVRGRAGTRLAHAAALTTWLRTRPRHRVPGRAAHQPHGA